MTDKEHTILGYIKGNDWYVGSRPEDSLLLYSLKAEGIRSLLGNFFKEGKITEMMLIPSKDGPLRAYNLGQTKEFHEYSAGLVQNNPNIIVDSIKEDEELWVEILSIDIIGLSDLRKIFRFYEVYSCHLYFIYSLGMALQAKTEKTKEDENILRMHDLWRNSATYNEELIEKRIKKYFANSLRLINNECEEIFKYLTAEEILALLSGTSNPIPRETISARKEGYIYGHLNEYGEFISEKPVFIRKVQSVFAEKNNLACGLHGVSVLKENKKVSGKAIVIKSKDELENLSGKIGGHVLVTRMTSPHFFHLLRGVKAIITDEGGITCHAAIVAREMRIPCVVGTKSATKQIKNDDLVEIDLDKGYISIVNK